MTRLFPLLCLGSLLAVSAHGYELRFQQAEYQVITGQVYEVRVLIDPVPTNGLFSVGVRMNYDSNFVQVVSTNDIILPAALDSNGLGGPSLKELRPGSAAGAGALDLEATNAYAQAKVMTFRLQNLAASGTVYQLDLDFFFDTNTNRADFVAFTNGEVLDARITNQVSSTVRVVSGNLEPEPVTIVDLSPPLAAVGRLAFTNITTALFDYVLEANTNEVDDLGWMPVAGGVLSTNAPGQFEFSLPVPSLSLPIQHYRIQTFIRSP
ncbi:MAG: hypothetical protein ACI9TH_003254 [Kiritimatiellia bacterium]|jgi:hypothetical protein